MPIITGYENVKRVYEQAAKKDGYCHALFRKLTTTEAILTAASELQGTTTLRLCRSPWH